MAIRRLCRSKRNLGTRCLVLSDSMVSILALSKGRSSSSGVNTICKRAAAYLIAGSISLHMRHIISEKNPADAPSRWHGEDLPKFKRHDVANCVDSGAFRTGLGPSRSLNCQPVQ